MAKKTIGSAISKSIAKQMSMTPAERITAQAEAESTKDAIDAFLEDSGLELNSRKAKRFIVLAKEYTAAGFGPKSPEFKQMRKLIMGKPKKS